MIFLYLKKSPEAENQTDGLVIVKLICLVVPDLTVL